MKTQFTSVLFVLALLITGFTVHAQGIIGITTSATGTPATYDAIVSKLKAKNLMDFGWTFHAIGAAQPTGLLSIGLYPNLAALDARLEKVRPVFQEAGNPVPMPQAYEVYRTFAAPFPAAKPAGGILVFFDMKGMTTAQYDQTVAGLSKVMGDGAPAGQLFHVAFKTEDGIKVIDIWESAERFQAFGGTLMPILQGAGVTPPPPAVYSLYNYVIPGK